MVFLVSVFELTIFIVHIFILFSPQRKWAFMSRQDSLDSGTFYFDLLEKYKPRLFLHKDFGHSTLVR